MYVLDPGCFLGKKHLSFPPTKQLIKRGGVTYSTDVTCLSWVWRESSILWGVEGGTSGGGAVLYKYVMRVWRHQKETLGEEAAAGEKKLLWESVCQTGYYCVSEYQPDRFRCLYG